MKKIEKLTDSQVAKFPIYVDKWKRIGLSTERADRKEAEKWVAEVYKMGGLEPPKLILWAQSPISGAIIATIFKNASRSQNIFNMASVEDSVMVRVWDSVWNSVGNSVWDSVWASVRDSVWDSVGDSVGDSVWDSVWASVRDSVGNSVGNSVWASVRASVGDSVRNSVRDSVRDSVREMEHGNHYAGALAFYDFFLTECQLDCCEKLIPISRLVENCGWFAPYKNVCILQEKPVEIHQINDHKTLHRDGGPAIRYADGFSVWALNGVRVSQEIAETPGDKLDCNLVLKEKNAEIRREIVRKIGNERLCIELNAEVVDKVGDYELLILDLKDNMRRPFLKMTNPSIGVYHIEGVHPDCKTVPDALNFRNGTREVPIKLT